MAAKKVMKLMVFNKEIIKPSSPTPSRLQTFKLSFIDKYAPVARMPLIFFYRTGGADINVGRRLKKSLSETLSRFYPVAGRLSADLHAVNCHDEGVPYHQVRANMPMSEALQRPDVDEIYRLIPDARASNKEGLALSGPLLEVQATYFECGGVAIGLSMSHKVGDATSLHIFAKAWSRASFGHRDLVVPDFIAPSVLPAQHPFQINLPPAVFEPENCIARRFVIDASKVTDLKAIAASDVVPHPTRTEVVSALLWKCSMKAADALSRSEKPSSLTWAVNLRSRLSPPLSDSSIGNIVALLAFQQQEKRESQLADLVRKLRQGIEEFNLHYVKDNQLQGGGEHHFSAFLRSSSSYHNMLQQGYADWNAHSSCCGSRLYDVDFGWGKPAWASIPASFSANMTVFTDTPHGGGIEVFAYLTKENMALLKHDPEFLEFASVNPSPLQGEK